jgi:sugar/nucleoside kinase (ribokinase family)
MNFWIERKRKELLDTISKVDVLVMNDAECRELAGEPNLIKASRKALIMGPDTIIVKKGEHGALMFKGDSIFSAPAFPCESVYDPTGAGDAFAGGFMGHLAKTGDTSDANIRRAVIYGTVMASFCVEQFSVDGMASLTGDDIDMRFRQLKEVSHFET